MPLAASISVNTAANQIRDNLNIWASEKGGVAVVASNLQDMWSQATQASDKPRILICYNGEISRGDFSIANKLHRVDRQWIVAVTRGRGFNANRGDSLTETKGMAEPFYTSVETVRDLIRVMVGISEEFPVDYKRISPMASANKALDCYAIEFSTANDIPDILLHNQNPPS